jgi:hypothetical protein
MLDTWSDDTLPSNEGVACIAGTERASIDSAAGETGIFCGGVGGTGELLTAPCSDGQRFDEGMVRVGNRFRAAGDVRESLRVVGVDRLVGRVLE